MRSPANARKHLRTDGQTDGRTDMPQNGHGWSDGPTDPCTGTKRLFQASDGRTDGQHENIMTPAPKGRGITNRFGFRLNIDSHVHIYVSIRISLH